YAGDSISTLAFFNILLSGQGNYAPNWPVELLEYPNLFDFVGNNPLDGIDPWGNVWYKPWTWNWVKASWVGIEHGVGAEGGTWKGAAECGVDMTKIAPGEINLRNNIQTNDDSDFNPPMQAGGGNGK